MERYWTRMRGDDKLSPDHLFIQDGAAACRALGRPNWTSRRLQPRRKQYDPTELHACSACLDFLLLEVAALQLTRTPGEPMVACFTGSGHGSAHYHPDANCAAAKSGRTRGDGAISIPLHVAEGIGRQPCPRCKP